MPEEEERKITYFTEDLRAQRPENMPQLPEGAPDPAEYMAGNFPAVTGSPDPTDYMPQFKPAPVEESLQHPSQDQPFLTSDQNRDLLGMMRQGHNSMVQDPYKFGQETPFGADLRHHQYERYYNHGDFEDLGFNPYRDNESLYNENSSWWDEMGRAAGEWGTLTGLGFKDALGFGDLSDTKTAEKYERAMAIGQSSKGGATGFTTNLFLNSGYTVGIMGELVMEELALAGITALTLGGSSEATVPLMVARGARAGNKIWRGFKTGAKLLKQMDNLRDANKARSLWTSAKAVGTGTLNFLNPLAETANFARNYNKLNKVNALGKTTMGFANFYRDIRNIRLAFGESGLEAGMVENQLSDELLEEHYRIHGRPPTDEEAAKMNQTSVAAAKTTQFHNMWAIFYSNKIVFDNMFKGFSPVRRLTEDVITKNASGRIMRTGAKDALRPFEVIEKGFKGFWQLAKNPRTYARSGLNYFRANIAEGLQETTQEVISGSAMDYYKAKHYGTVTEGGYWAAIGNNLQKQVSMEGLETFMSGFLMGGLVQGPQKLVTGGAKYGHQRYKNKGNYAKIKQERIDYLNDTVNTLNDMYEDPRKYFAPDLENMVEQKEYNSAINSASKNGDAKTFHDLKDASVHKDIMTALKMGRIDTFIEKLKSLENLTTEEIQESYNMTKEQYTEGMQKTIERAEQIKQRYELVQDKYESPFNPSAHKYGSDAYIQEALNNKAWENAQSDLIFMQHSFDRSLERMTSIMNEAKNDAKLGNTPMSDFNVMFSFKDMQTEMDQLTQEIDSLEGSITKESKAALKKKQNKKKLLSDFADAMGEYMSSPAAVETAEPVEGAPVAASENAVENKDLTKAFQAYKAYISDIAQVNGDHVFNDSIEAAFTKIVDYYQLDTEATQLNDSVNALLDPGAFTRHAGRIAEVLQHQHDNRKEKIEQALKEWMKVKDTNDLMQLLHDEGMFFDPAELKALLDEGSLPSTFFYIESKEEVLQTSEDYQTALDIIRKFVENVMDIPIPEAQPQPYNGKARNKINGDKRTYKDLAKQFGFDPETASSKVPLPQVLQSVIDSPFATYREKDLAARLLSIASPEETVTFVNNNTAPGHYSTVEQTVIDARYSSHDYRGGRMPIEHTILHEEIHRRTVEELQNDSEFTADIDALLVKARAYAESETGKENWKGLPLYGLKNKEEFVAEAMSNDTFQMFLAEIPYDNVDKSGWTDFVDSVLKFLKKVFGRKITNTALNAAVDIITAKIDSNYGATALQLTESNQAIALALRMSKGEMPSTPADLQLQANNAELIEKVLKVERERAAELEKNGYRIPVKRESRTLTDDTRTIKVIITTMADGSKVVTEEITNLQTDEVDSTPPTKYAAELENDKIYEVHNADQEEYGEVTVESIPDSAVAAKVNEKYDKQLVKLAGPGKKKKVIAEAGGLVKVTRTMPMEELRRDHPQLAAQLMRAYKEEEAKRTREDLQNLNPTWSEMSDEDIYNSVRFKSYVKNFSKPKAIFKAYNTDTGRTEEPKRVVGTTETTTSTTTTPASTIMTRAMRESLVGLGYTPSEVNAMTPGQAQILIEEGIQKGDREVMDAAAEETQRQEFAEQKDKVRADILNIINAATNIEELDAAEIELHNIFMDPNLRRVGEVTSEYIQELISTKMRELAFAFTFDDIQMGEVVILNDQYNTKIIIDGKTGNTLQAHKLNDITKRFRIKKDTVTDRIKYRYSPAMAEVGITPESEPTAEEQNLSNQSLEEVVNNPEATQEMIDKAREGGETGWLDNVNECE
jgi:hypothetical protein